MRGIVKYNGIIAGFLDEVDGGFSFTYQDEYFKNPDMPQISLNIPKEKKQHLSIELHPFFVGILSEGINKKIQCQVLGIDENDDFVRLLKTAKNTIGAITVEEEK